MSSPERSDSRGRPARVWWALAALAAAGCALVSTGFVHESVQARREAARRGWRASLGRALSEAEDAAWRRASAHWRRPSEERRRRGRGYGRSAERAALVQRYDFTGSGSGVGVATALSADVIRATLRHHDGLLGGCLLRHGARGVDIQFEVGSGGRLRTVRLDLDGAAGACVRKVLEGVRFPARSGGRAQGSYQVRMQ